MQVVLPAPRYESELHRRQIVAELHILQLPTPILHVKHEDPDKKYPEKQL